MIDMATDDAVSISLLRPFDSVLLAVDSTVGRNFVNHLTRSMHQEKTSGSPNPRLRVMQIVGIGALAARTPFVSSSGLLS